MLEETQSIGYSTREKATHFEDEFAFTYEINDRTNRRLSCLVSGVCTIIQDMLQYRN